MHRFSAREKKYSIGFHQIRNRNIKKMHLDSSIEWSKGVVGPQADLWQGGARP